MRRGCWLVNGLGVRRGRTSMAVGCEPAFEGPDGSESLRDAPAFSSIHRLNRDMGDRAPAGRGRVDSGSGMRAGGGDAEAYEGVGGFALERENEGFSGGPLREFFGALELELEVEPVFAAA